MMFVFAMIGSKLYIYCCSLNYRYAQRRIHYSTQRISRRISQLNRYIFTIHGFTIQVLSTQIIILGISSNYRYSQRRIFFKKDEPEPSYGAFAQIQLVENETCNLSTNSVNDTCSKYDQFLARFDIRYYANKYRRQNENLFSFNRPTCNRRC